MNRMGTSRTHTIAAALMIPATALALIAPLGCARNAANAGDKEPANTAVPDTGPVAAAVREAAIALLVEQASGTSPELRANAIEGLSAAPSRLKPILPVALADESAGVRAVAAMVLGRHPMPGMTGHLQPLLNDPSPFVRISAIYALRRAGEPTDLSPLANALFSDDAALRAHTAFVLGELREPSALAMVREAARDPMMRSAPAGARLALLQLAEARVKLGDDEALHEVRAALYPSRPEELEATALAAQIIGEVRDAGSTDQLIYLTARKDDSGRMMPAEVRLAAAASLAKLGHPEGDFIAREYVTSPLPTLRSQASLLLGQVRKQENLGTLSTLLADPDPAVRTAAAAGVLQITDAGSH